MSNYTPIPPLAQYQPYLVLSRLLLGLREGEVRSFTNTDINSNNSPFYISVLGCQAFEQEWG